MPRVSVVTPCYGAEAFLARTIQSLQAQTMRDWEQVIVDDGSPGDVGSVVAPFLQDQRLKLIHQQNRGLCNARNSGVAACSKDSRYFLFLDADDCLEPAMLETMTEYLDVHPKLSFAFCDRILVDAQDQVIPYYRDDLIRRYVPTRRGLRKLGPDEPATPFESFFGYSIAVPSVTLIRRLAYEEVGPWDESLGPFFEDTDMWLRLTLRGEAHYVPHKLVRRRLHGNQITRSPLARRRQREGTAKFERKWRAAAGLSATERARVRRARWFKEGRVVPHLWFAWTRDNLRRGRLRDAGMCFLRGCRQVVLHLPGAVLSSRVAVSARS